MQNEKSLLITYGIYFKLNALILLNRAIFHGWKSYTINQLSHGPMVSMESL